MTRHAIIFAAALALLAPARALAQEELPQQLDQAQRERLLSLLQDGRQAFQHGRYQEALERFEAAYTISPIPSLWLRRAQCLEKLNQTTQAIEAYERFIAASDDPTANERAQRTIALLKQRQRATLLISSQPSQASIYQLDPQAQRPSTLLGTTPKRFEIEPNTPLVLEIVHEDHITQRHELTLAPGETRQLDLILIKATPVQAPTTRADLRPVGFGLAGASLIGAGLTTWAWITYAQHDRTLTRYDQRRDLERPSDYDNITTSRNQALVATWIGAALTLGLGAGGAYLILRPSPQGASATISARW